MPAPPGRGWGGAEGGFGLGRERIRPVEAGLTTELEVRDERQREPIRVERPAAGGVEAPAPQARARGRDPAVVVGLEERPVVVLAAEVAARRRAAGHHVDAEGEEAVAARGDEPAPVAVGGDGPARARGAGG